MLDFQLLRVLGEVLSDGNLGQCSHRHDLIGLTTRRCGVKGRFYRTVRNLHRACCTDTLRCLPRKGHRHRYRSNDRMISVSVLHVRLRD